MNVEHGHMERDERDEWPKDTPVGTFDLSLDGVEGYPGVTGSIHFICPNRHRCSVLIAPQPIPKSSEDRLHVWGFDGNLERPTLTPSINCIAEKDGKPTGGCGWHGFITDGVIR